jgi:hypothetical protein
VGYLLHEGGEPMRMRSFYLTDDDLTQLARRAETLRAVHAKATNLSLIDRDQDRHRVEGEGAA